MKIIFLAGKGEGTLFMYNALKDNFPIDRVIIEDKMSSMKIIKGRIKRFGYFKVMNQLLFQLTVSKLLRFLSKKRIAVLKKHYKLLDEPISVEKILNVSSVNDFECIEAIKELNADVIIVNGTRIISSKVLESTSALFINTHAGITPQYRGVHGAYWALVSNDKENCGVTVHKVDKGIDTGEIVKQSTIEISKPDNFITYPFHQYGVAIDLMKATLNDIKNNNFKSFKKENVKSNLYYHPTFSGYFYNRLFKGVK
jgi:methionyl-tRNA formyltransferase